MIEELWLDTLQVMSPGSIVFNGYHVNGFTGIGSPPPRSNRPTRGRRQGSFELTSFYEPRTFTARVWIFGENGNSWDWPIFWAKHEALLDAVSLASFTRKIQFRRTGDPFGHLEEAYVTPDGEIEPEFPHGGTPAAYLDLTLVAADPRLYSGVVKSITASGTFSIINAGTFNTPPLITLTGVGSAILTNNSLTTENKLYIKNAGGGTVVINVRDRTITLNGAPAPQIFDADKSFFWALTSGINNISVSGTVATIEWQDARV